LRQKHRLDWPAAFSTNSKGDVWGFLTYGYTPRSKRDNLRGHLALLDQIADIYWNHREDGGRFFIDERGAFFKRDNVDVQFVEWISEGEKLQAPVTPRAHHPSSDEFPMTFKQLQEQVAAARRTKKR
jgi:hypothetical protein